MRRLNPDWMLQWLVGYLHWALDFWSCYMNQAICSKHWKRLKCLSYWHFFLWWRFMKTRDKSMLMRFPLTEQSNFTELQSQAYAFSQTSIHLWKPHHLAPHCNASKMSLNSFSKRKYFRFLVCWPDFSHTFLTVKLLITANFNLA